MKVLLFAVLFAFNTWGAHFTVQTLSCKSVERQSPIPTLVFQFRVGADQNIFDIESVHARNGSRYLADDEKTTDTWYRAKISGGIVKFKHEQDYGRTLVGIDTGSGSLEMNLQEDDNGTAVTAYLNSDGPRLVLFYRCQK